MLRLREKSYGLDGQEREVVAELDQVSKAQEALYNELIKRQSD